MNVNKVVEALQQVISAVQETQSKPNVSSNSDLSASIGDISKFSKLNDGWVRWSLINRDFGPEKELKWKEGADYSACKGGRLGNRLEHFLLYWAMKENPEIEKIFFPNAKKGWYWTEEEVAGYSSYAWVVYASGLVDDASKDNYNYVRPCRASQNVL